MSIAATHPGRTVCKVHALDDLVGAHPDALAGVYRAGRVAPLSLLGSSPRGRLLGVTLAPEAFLAVRGVVRLFATDKLPWRGKSFSDDFSRGHNVVLGRNVAPFRIETGNSAVDGAPTTILRYDDPADKNPAPLRAIRDEIREVSAGIFIGPILRDGHVIGWWGLERRG